jgi:L-amino acid N-acyltransferase YncA
MNIALRESCVADSPMILGWRNSTDAREFSRNQRVISPEEHESWFVAQIGTIPQSPFWITTLDDIPFGYVRFDSSLSKEKIFEVSIFISESYRNFGMGKKSLELALKKLGQKFPCCSVVATVHHENIASTKLFTDANFQLVSSHNSFQVLSLTLK